MAGLGLTGGFSRNESRWISNTEHPHKVMGEQVHHHANICSISSLNTNQLIRCEVFCVGEMREESVMPVMTAEQRRRNLSQV